VLERCKILVFFIVLTVASFKSLSQPAKEQYSKAQFKAATLKLQSITNNKLALKKSLTLSRDYALNPEQVISLSTITAHFHYLDDNLPAAIKSLEHAIDIAKDNNLVATTAGVQKKLGIMFHYSRLNARALIAYKQAIALLNVENEPLKVANLYNNIGLVHANMGDLSLAMDNYSKAYTLYQAHGSDQDRTDSYFNIAGLHIHLEHFDMAIKMIPTVIRARKLYQDHSGVANAYGDLGTAYLKAGNYPQARLFYEKSLHSYTELKENYFIASQHHNLAEVDNLLGNTTSAMKHATLAIALSESTGNSYSLIGGYHALALAQYLEGDFAAAYKNIVSSLDLAQEKEISDWANDYLGLKALIQSAQGKTKAGFLSQMRSIELINRQKNDELSRQMVRYQDKTEANELARALAHLKQREQIARQQRYFVMFVLLLFLIMGFSFYRRRINLKLQFDLRHLVAKRTSELDLLAEDLKQANLVKGQFLANVSHEIRTPLTSIIGHAKSLVSGDVNRQNNDAEVILRNSVHVSSILNDILDLSSIEVNKLKISYQMQAIDELVEEIRLLYHSESDKKGIQFIIENQLPTDLHLYTDRVRLKQILINLCSNALKFTSHGHIKIGLSLVDDVVTIKISDTGIGIENENFLAIFERFTQADSSINRRFGGSGIGLYLSLELAQMLGGNISVASKVNQGSEFTLSLPFLKQAPNGLESYETPSLPIEQLPDVSLHGTVLLAEDHDDNRQLISRLLTALGLTVLQAHDGEEAINLCTKHQPDLILMDIQMPNIDGIDALHTLRNGQYSQPIIAFTANSVADDMDYYLELGFDDCLSKPIDEPKFVKTISHYLNQNEPKESQAILSSVDLSDLVQEFISSLPEEHSKLLAVVAVNDYDGIARLVHRLSGAASMFGFDVMATLGGEIYAKINNNELDGISNLLKILLEMMAQTSAVNQS